MESGKERERGGRERASVPAVKDADVSDFQLWRDEAAALFL